MADWRGDRGPIETSPENVGWSNTSDTHLPFHAQADENYRREVWLWIWGQQNVMRRLSIQSSSAVILWQTDGHRAAFLLHNIWMLSDRPRFASCADRNTEQSSLVGCYAVSISKYLPKSPRILMPPSSSLYSRSWAWTRRQETAPWIGIFFPNDSSPS